MSEDFKILMRQTVDKKKLDLETQTVMENRKSVTAQLASFTCPNRQQLSGICVQEQSRLLLDKPEGLGGVTGETARRRKQTAFLEDKWEREQEAQIIAARQGWRICQNGDFKLKKNI